MPPLLLLVPRSARALRLPKARTKKSNVPVSSSTLLLAFAGVTGSHFRLYSAFPHFLDSEIPLVITLLFLLLFFLSLLFSLLLVA